MLLQRHFEVGAGVVTHASVPGTVRKPLPLDAFLDTGTRLLGNHGQDASVFDFRLDYSML
jgi:hypothetical protein